MVADTKHQSFPQPADSSVTLWRYMNMAKFVWCLQSKALFFARSDRLGDAYEGYHTKQHILGGADPKLLEALKTMRADHFVSSWHMNDRDSAAMWRLYTSLDE